MTRRWRPDVAARTRWEKKDACSLAADSLLVRTWTCTLLLVGTFSGRLKLREDRLDLELAESRKRSACRAKMSRRSFSRKLRDSA